MRCLSIEQCVELVLSGPGTLEAEAAHVRKCADCTARLEQMQYVLGRVEGAMSRFDRDHATGRRRLVEALPNVAIEQPPHAPIGANHQADEDLLTRLTAGQDMPVRPAVSSSLRRRYLMRVLVPAAAAALIVLGGLGLFLLNTTTSVALADVIKAAEKHKLVKYKSTQTTEVKIQNDKFQNLLTTSTDSVSYADLKAPRFREESKILYMGAVESASVDIVDHQKGLHLSTFTEMAVPDAEKDAEKAKVLARFPKMLPVKHAVLVRSVDGQDPKKKQLTILEHLRELQKHKEAVVSKDKLGGRETVKYYIEDGKKTTKLWVDAKTNLPVRLESEMIDATPDTPLIKFVHTDFDWDPELKGFKSLDELFDTNPPAGYEATVLISQGGTGGAYLGPRPAGKSAEDEHRARPQKEAKASEKKDAEARKTRTRESWQVGATLIGHTDQVNAVAFSADGRILASAGEDCVVILWDITTGKPRTTLRGHKEPVHCVAISPDGKLVASGSFENSTGERVGQVKLWDATSGKERASFTLGKTGGPVYAVAFTPDGKFLAAAGEMRPFEIEDGKIVDAGVLKMWDTSTEELRAGLTEEGASCFKDIAFSPDGGTLAICCTSNVGDAPSTVKLWRWPEKKGLFALEATQEAQEPARAEHPNPFLGSRLFYRVRFSPDGETLATLHTSAGVQFWDAKTGKEEERKRIKLGKYVSAITYSTDGKTLAIAEAQFEIKDKVHVSRSQVSLWDTATGKMRQRLPEEETFVSSVAFSRDGRRLATGSRGNVVGDKRGVVKVWELRP